MDIQVIPKTMRLRRQRPQQPPACFPKEEVIQKNLQPLKQNIQKKQRAQEAYYQNNNSSGTSPMTRDIYKQPVRQRLGRKVPFNGTNTSLVPPKKRVYKNLTQNNSINKRKMLKRTNYAQTRLNKIREKQKQALIENNPNTPKKIKLRRIIPNVCTTNFKVQVKNNGMFFSNPVNEIKRHKIILNSEIQLAIAQLRDLCTQENITIYKVTPRATNICLNERFSNLS